MNIASFPDFCFFREKKKERKFRVPSQEMNIPTETLLPNRSFRPRLVHLQAPGQPDNAPAPFLVPIVKQEPADTVTPVHREPTATKRGFEDQDD